MASLSPCELIKCMPVIYNTNIIYEKNNLIDSPSYKNYKYSIITSLNKISTKNDRLYTKTRK